MNNSSEVTNNKPINPEDYNQAIRDLTHLNLQLRRLDKAKDEFISIASHELRNPMAIIKGTISMVLAGDDGEINDEVRSDLRDVLVVVERQIRLVNELLDISRIEAGVILFNLTKSLNLLQLANLLAESLNQSIENDGVKVEVEKKEIPTVQGDQDKVTQVLINLVSNALKFTKTGFVKISFKADKSNVVTSVSDTGSGMPEEKKNELFKKFTKPGDPKVGTMSPGSGLGLYISKKYIEHLGGKLWLKSSEVGKGSTFCFSLPITNSETATRIEQEVSAMSKIKQAHFNKGGG